MNKKNFKFDEGDITLVELQQENEALKRQATMYLSLNDFFMNIGSRNN